MYCGNGYVYVHALSVNKLLILMICLIFVAVYYLGYLRRRKDSFISSIIHWLWHINSLSTDCHNSTSVLQVSSQLGV